ncbi:ABC transporter permease [Fructobacillus ficulneus]|uniref:ABC transporter permease n=1 Tax=Fructobacillus ficulneus TaxID=157463 RepID=A0A0K8MG06_9LACO|nr:ABC transporter permease [Fructobacillus ficulneus]GAO99133.1 hypothetical protein FFIC_030130 [Fructobacillus ficulneus]
MFTLLKQEAMKAWKQNRVYIWAILVFLVPIIIIPLFIPANTQSVAYGSFGGSGIIISVAGAVLPALTFSQEFTFGTIRPLLSRQYSRLQIFISKLITVLAEYILLIAIAFAGTMLGRQIYIGMHGSSQTSINFGDFFFAMLMEVVGGVFLIGVVILVSNIAKSSAAAISLGIVMSVATPILAAITTYLVKFWDGFKWNPLTILQGVQTYDNSAATKLDLHDYFGTGMWVVFLVYAVYLVLLYGIAFSIFNRRSV